MSRLLPYHACAGHLPTQDDFSLGQQAALVGESCNSGNKCSQLAALSLPVDQEFDTVSTFLLNRTKDMVNKYRQLLVREAQVRPPPTPSPVFI